MHRGFNLKLNVSKKDIENYHHIGLSLFESDRKSIEKTIESFKIAEDKIDGTKLQASWFPTVKADVFISHSHKDKDDVALTLAGWLSDNFKIRVFIDSCIWGYSDELLKLIDNTYCWTDDKHLTYNYEKRNYSTSHIHMMLNTALSTMIDETECLLFLNTPNSITPETEINKTLSPWIYSEIAMSRLIRIKDISDYRDTERRSSTFLKSLIESEIKKFFVAYDVDLSHLTEIDEKSLRQWKNSGDYEHAHDALDALYALNPISL